MNPADPGASLRAANLSYRSYGAQAFHYFMRDHTSPPTRPVVTPAAWSGRDLRQRESEWRVRLCDTEIEELDVALDRLDRDAIPLDQIHSRAQSLRLLTPRIEGWRHELTTGRGFLVLSGLPVERWGETRSARAFWLLGHHLGTPGAQNPDNELLGHVIDYQERSNSPNARLYRTAANIGFHCDAADVVGLLCLETASRGGESRIASSVAIWNALFEQDPAAARSLFEPWPLDRRDENPPDQARHLDLQPCCYSADGQLRTFYHSEYFRSVERLPEIGPLTEEHRAALDQYDALGHSPDYRLDMRLERGDVQLLSNHTIVHARTEYHDTPTRRRHLLRLWLSLPQNPT